MKFLSAALTIGSMKSVEDKHYERLLKDSVMLSQIAAYIEDFCRPDSEDTTFMGVVRLLAEYHSLKSESLYYTLESLQKHNEEKCTQ